MACPEVLIAGWSTTGIASLALEVGRTLVNDWERDNIITFKTWNVRGTCHRDPFPNPLLPTKWAKIFGETLQTMAWDRNWAEDVEGWWWWWCLHRALLFLVTVSFVFQAPWFEPVRNIPFLFFSYALVQSYSSVLNMEQINW
jgi:hypothetical protein